MSDDYTGQTGQPDDANDNGARRRMMEFILRSALKPSLPALQRNGSESPDSGNESAIPGSTNQPRVPAPKITSTEPPTLRPEISPIMNTLGNPATRPRRPNVAPTREDFPARPEVSGWKKVLGLGLSALAGPQAGPLAEKILHGQRDAAERQYGQAVQDWERGQGDEERAARIENLRSEARARDNKPDKEVKPELEAWNDLMKQNIPPREAYEILKSSGKAEPQAKTPSFEEQNYAEWAATQKAAGKPSDRMTFERQRAAATQKPERPERTLITVPQPDGSSKVVEATPGMVIPKGAKTVPQLGKESEPTADEQRRADLANNLTENLDRLEEIVKRRPELFGPASGRLTSAKQWFGTGDPDVAALDNIKEQVGLAMVGAHAMRNAQHAEKAANSILNAYKNKPEALLGERGSISSARNSLKTFIGDVEGQRVQDKTPGGAKGAPIQVTDPNGGVHTFPDQASADTFKKLAKIQ